MLVQPIQPLVLPNFVEDGEQGCGAGVGGDGLSVFGIVEVLVQAGVEASTQRERFDGEGAGVEFVGVAEVDEGVCYYIHAVMLACYTQVERLPNVKKGEVWEREDERTSTNQPIDQRLLALEQILVQQTLPIVPHSNELVFEEIDERTLITTASSAHDFHTVGIHTSSSLRSLSSHPL